MKVLILLSAVFIISQPNILYASICNIDYCANSNQKIECLVDSHEEYALPWVYCVNVSCCDVGLGDFLSIGVNIGSVTICFGTDSGCKSIKNESQISTSSFATPVILTFNDINGTPIRLDKSNVKFYKDPVFEFTASNVRKSLSFKKGIYKVVNGAISIQSATIK